jgi:hypothetical protein
MELAAKPMPNPAVIYRPVIANEAVLVNPDTGASLALNASGCVVWELVDGERSVEQIVDRVRGHFRDVPDSVGDDVIALLDSLAQEGFVGLEWTPERTEHE